MGSKIDYLNKSRILIKKKNDLKVLKQNLAPKMILDNLPACLSQTPTLEMTVETTYSICVPESSLS